MREGRMIFMLVLVTLFLVVGLTGCEKGVFPELVAAQEAVDAAKAEGAPDLCPDEYATAELKLKQAQLLYEDKEKEAATQAAVEAQEMGKNALDCTLLAKQPEEESMVGIPGQLKKFKASIFFDFNDNTLSEKESNKVGHAAALITKYQGDYQFWVIVKSHADLPGSPEDNLLITDRRARVVRYILISKGVEEDRILIKPMGESLANKELIVEGKGAKDLLKKKNPEYRRTDITVVPNIPDEDEQKLKES